MEARISRKPSRINRLRYGVVTFAMCASLGAGALTLVGTADAAPNNGNTTSDGGRSCKEIKSSYDRELAQEMKAKNSKIFDFFHYAVQDDIHEWNAQGCKGNISEALVAGGAAVLGVTTSAIGARAQ